MSEWFWRQLNYWAGVAATFFLFALIIFSASIEIKDLDLWLHLATGKYIVESRVIPETDILSATIAGTPWINHEWLFQVIVYFIHRWAGFEGLIQLQVVVVSLTFMFLFLMGDQREKPLLTLILLLLAVMVYQLRFTIRPDIFSLFFFVLYAFFLGSRLERKSIIGILVLLQIIWNNVHGFFILGPVLAWLSLGGEWVKRRVPLPFEWNTAGRLSDLEYKRLKQVAVAVLLACLVNPYFIKGAVYPVGVLLSSFSGHSKVFFDHISELQKSVSLSTLFSLADYPAYKLLIFISLSSFLLNYKRVDVGIFFFWLIFLFMSLNAVRNVVFFAFAAYLTTTANFASVPVNAFLPPAFSHFRWRYGFAILAKVFLSIWIMNYIAGLSIRGYFDFDTFERKSEYGGISLRNFPYKAVDFLVDNDIRGNFLNDFNSGAYLLGRTFPGIKIFIDGRTEVYGAEFFEKYKKIWKGDRRLFEEAVQKYNLTGAFLNSVYIPVPKKFLEHLYYDQNWILVYFDYDATIFLRDIPENQKWIQKFRIDLNKWQPKEADLLKFGLHPVAPYQNLNRADALYNLGFWDKAQEECRQALRIAPNYPDAYKLIGKIHFKKKEWEQAFEYLRKAKVLYSEDLETRFLLAVLLYRQGDLENSKIQVERVLAGNPKNPKARSLLNLIIEREESQNQMPADIDQKISDLAEDIDDPDTKISAGDSR